MKLLNIMALLLIKPRDSDQDNHFTRRTVAWRFVRYINPINVNISRHTKNLDLSPGNICKLEH